MSGDRHCRRDAESLRRVGPLTRLTACCLVLLLVLAGCGSATDTPSPTATPVPEGDATSTPVPTPTSTLTPTETASPTPTATPAPENAWAKNPVRVAVEVGADARSGPFETQVREALAFYSERSPALTGHDVRFELVEDAERADVVVRYRPLIRQCGDETTAGSFFWCTEAVIRPTDAAPDRTNLTVASAYADNATDQFLRAGLAQLLGVRDVESVDELAYDPERVYAYADPWPGENDLVVAVDDTAETDRNYTRLVRAGVDYWMEADDRYGTYTADWRVEPNATDPDVVVQFVEQLERCGVEPPSETLLGCASLLRDGLANETEVVRIETGYTDESTVATIRHEFGHLYGLGHDDEPQPLMNATYPATRLAQPNASTKANPFPDDEFTVYLAYEDSQYSESVLKAAVGPVLSYYANGADGHAPANVSFTYTRDESAADLVVYERQPFPCNLDEGSCASVFGFDSDDDGAFETYDRYEIYVRGIPEDRLGWHVGAQMAGMFPALEAPPPFDGEDDDRNNWDQGR